MASVIKRWNGSVQMSWRMASQLWDRLSHHNAAVAKVPVLNVDVSAAALLVHLDAASLRTLLGLTASVLHFFQYKDYRRLRPQASLHLMLLRDCAALVCLLLNEMSCSHAHSVLTK